MENIGLHVAKMWHEILMNSSTEEDVIRFSELMKHSPVEIQIIIMAGTNKELLLRDYSAALRIPKSTLTSIINRLEKQQLISRTISGKDRRSYSLRLKKKGRDFLNTYGEYQNNIGNRIISGLDETERQQLVALLKKVSSYMVRREMV